MRNILFIFLIVLIYGCGSNHNIQLTPDLKLTSQSIHIDAPSSSYGVAWEAWYLTSAKNNIQLFRHLPNMMSEDVRMTVKTVPAGEKGMYGLLNKNFDLEANLQQPLTEWEKKNIAERGVKYRKKYVDFIGGLKCSSSIEKANLALGVGSAKYGTTCAYYDTSGGRKEIYISYRYTYAHNSTKFDGENSSSIYSPQAMQTQFKQDIKAIFDSLVIHDMDREKMSKEGLLHDKKYDIDSEYR